MSAGTGRGDFRPGEDLAPGNLLGAFPDDDIPAADPPSLEFSLAAEAGGTDFDVLMGYQLFLGRDPESSFVIADAKTSPVGAFIRALMGSGEFQSAVLDKLAAGRPLPHENAAIAASPEQLGWLLRHVRLPAAARAALRAAPGWREFLSALVAVPGFPHAPARGEADQAGSGIPAQAADEGFVLVHLEQPKAGEWLGPGSTVHGVGWAIAPADVAEVAVHLDGLLLTHARYGLPRPDVARSFPHYRHVDHCGFTFTVQIPPEASVQDASQLVVSVRTARGEVGRKAVRLHPPTEAKPVQGNAGAPESWPIRLAVDEAAIDGDRTLRLRGWCASLLPIRALTASLGGTALGEVRHGLPRLDIARLHPGYPNAGLSGFALVHRLAADLPGGPGFVRVQAEDGQGRTRQAILPVTLPGAHLPFQPALPAPSEADDASGPRCACDAASLSAAGVLAVTGWAIDPGGVVPVEIELDGVLLGTALTGRPRPDIGRRFPGDAGAWQAGFAFGYTLDRAPKPGPHVLSLRVLGRDGERLIERQLGAGVAQADAQPMPDSAAGPAASGMRVEIDHPELAGDVAMADGRGALSLSGWAVARQGIASVSVFAGAELLGEAHTGMRREDIGATFADFAGSLLSGFALVVPPGALPAGQHAIRVVATARAKTTATPETAERRFTLRVDPTDRLPQGCDIRTRLPPAEIAFGLRLLARQDFAPVFEVTVTGAKAAAASALAATLGALANQAYGAWRATVLVADKAASSHPALQALLATDPARVKASWPGKAAPRRVAGASKPDFALRLRAGDVLGADALLTLAIEAATAPQADFIYADELRHDPTQGRLQPWLKPDWSPNLLLATNYVGRAWCARQALMEQADIPLDAGDYETVLRLTELAHSIRHAPRVLWRRGEAADSQAREQAALSDCLARRGIAGQVEPAASPLTWRVRRALPPLPRGKAKGKAGARVAGRISIVMPTCAARGLIRAAIRTIRESAAPAVPDGRRIEIVILDNTPASETATRAWLRKAADIVIDMPGPFNWSRFNNAGAAAATGDMLLFLNDDIEATGPGWLEAMLEHAQRPEVGVVGARLLYPDGKVQHAGQYLAGGHARHAFRFDDGNAPGPFGLACVAREMISVTGACLMVRADVFATLGGFDEAHDVVNNDLDFCLRAWREGLSVVFTPHATLVHHELASRAALEDSYDTAGFEAAWRGRFQAGDPFRNPGLDPHSDQYAPQAEPVVALHVGRRGPAAADMRRILAVKLDHIGDFLTALPALRALSARFPTARIDLLAPAATAELARAEPCLGEIHVFDFFHARSGEGQKGVGALELAALHDRLAPLEYDMAIDLRMQPETRTVLPHTGAGFLVGYDHDHRFGFLDVALEWEGDRKLEAKRAHVSERLVDLVAAAHEACRDAPPAPSLAPLRPQDVPALAALPEAFLARRLVCVHAGVGNPVRQWPPGHYAALIDLLAGDGLGAVLIGGPDEAGIADEVLRRVTAPGAAESLVGRVKLGELGAVMRACALFVGNNSGPHHLAASLGVPTIGIHSGVVDAAEWAPLGAQAMALRRRMVCGPCYLEFASDCPRDLACLAGLRPSDVLAACRRLLVS